MIKTRVRILAVAACAAGLAVTAVVASAAGRTVTPAPAASPSVALSARPGVSDSPCVEDAVGAIPAAAKGDGRWLDIWKNNPASQAPGSDARPLGRGAAVDAARIAAESPSTSQAADDGAHLTASVGGAVKVAYARAAASIGDDVREGIVAPDRCVWLVTVDAPFTPRSAPYGVERPTFDSYTMIFDVATGQYLATAAGSAAPNVLSGRNVAVAEASQ